MGSSFEPQHDLATRHLSQKATGIQLQRARSMEFDINDNEESETAEESLGGSTLSLGSTNDDDTKRMLESMKTLMKRCDSIGLKIDSPKNNNPQQGLDRRSSAEINSVRSFRGGNLPKSPMFGPRNLSSRSVSSQPTGAVGGIGAALSQYRGSTNSLSNDSENGSEKMSRVASYGRLREKGLPRVPEMISAGMSPLLLPPPTQVSETLRSDHRLASERRFVEAQRYGSADNGFIRPSRGRLPEPPVSNHPKSHNLLSSSPPKPVGVKIATKTKRSTSKTSRKKKAFNPFRQQDEDEVLAEKSHNRRRWSHVFPVTEVEFKRHVSHKLKSPIWRVGC